MIEFRMRNEKTACGEKAAIKIAEALGLDRKAARLLALRGIRTPEEAQAFLHPSAAQMHDPFAFEDMGTAVRILEKAVSSGEKIVVYSDYDADGVCAASILYLFLKSISADVSVYTPHRHREGYGMNAQAVETIAAGGAGLVVTVDCGITNAPEIRLAQSLGMRVIVTDHHECPDTLPPADAVVNPKRRGCAYPFRHLCGAGIALKIVEAMAGRDAAMRYIDLAALGTIADIVPLLGENRVIAAVGLQKMRKKPQRGVRLLAQAAQIDIKNIDARGVSFGLAPRINAASRMDDAALAVALFTAEEEQAAGAATRLCEHNRARQQIEEEIAGEAFRRVGEIDLREARAVLLADDGWNTGVIGIVASQMLDRLYRPVILFGAEGEHYVGSARSTDEVNIFEALSRFSHLFLRFGGHAHAAGLTLAKDNLVKLREGLNAYLSEAYPEEPVKKTAYDLEIRVKDANPKLVSELKLFEPFGQDNPKPLFRITHATAVDPSYVGKTAKDHLRLTLREEEERERLSAICFGHMQRYCFLSKRNEYAATLSINGFDRRPQAQIEHIKPMMSRETLAAYVASIRKELAFVFAEEMQHVPAAWTQAQGFEESLQKDLARSRFHTLVLFNSEEGLKRALKMPCIRRALAEERIEIPCERQTSPQACNTLMFMGRLDEAVAGRYTRVYCVGAFSLDGGAFVRLFDDALRRAYGERARRVFMRREELLALYRKTVALSEKRKAPVEAADIAASAGVSLEKCAFALRVFLDLGLIACGNNDTIQCAKQPKGKKDLESSRTYRVFAKWADAPPKE